jgi:hypothetical protein
MTRALIATVAAALAIAGAGRAEMPYNAGAPEVTGRTLIGWGVVGHNGAWLYADGSACGAECFYSFEWERCRLDVCAPIPGATSRVYKVRVVDAGARLRVVVSATKRDCNAHGVDCRYVTRYATSPQTEVVPKPLQTAKRKPKRKPRRPSAARG